MHLLKLIVAILLSYMGVWAQKHVPSLNQWIFVYVTVFIVSWFGGLFLGMVSTILSLALAAFMLYPKGSFGLSDLTQLVVLSSLGFWISFSMDQYKKSRIKLSTTEELAKSLGFLDALLENIPMLVFVKDAKDLRFVKMNNVGLNLLGYTKEEVIGKNDDDLFPKEQADYFRNRDQEVLLMGGISDYPREVIDTKKFGQRILQTKKISITDMNGKPQYLLGVSEDVTEKIEDEKLRNRILADEAVKRERSQLQEKEVFISKAISTLSSTLDYNETLDRLVDILVPTFGDWCTITVRGEDGSFSRVAGIHHDLSLMPLLDEFNRNYPPNEKDVEILKALEDGRSTLTARLGDELLRLRSQDLRKFEIYKLLGTESSMVVPIKARAKVMGVLSVARGEKRFPLDELDLALVEEIGRRAGTVLENSLLFKSTQKAVRARDEFLSIASHELKTPMTSLKMQIQMLLRSNENEKVKKSLGNALNQVDRLTLLVNDLLDVSRLDSGKMSYKFQNFPISELIKDVGEVMKNEFHLLGTEFHVTLNSQAEVKGDRYRLEQVLVNLVSNARKYGLGKPVSISVEDRKGDIVISVKDEGKGIPKEVQNKIFEKFERGSQDSNISGLGLGLFISQEIVLAHGGRIEIQSEVDQGSTFRVILPAARDE